MIVVSCGLLDHAIVTVNRKHGEVGIVLPLCKPEEVLQFFRRPVGWYDTNPLITRTLHRHSRVEAVGDGVADEGRAFLLKKVDHLFLLSDQGADPGRLSAEKSDDVALLIKGRKANHIIADKCL